MTLEQLNKYNKAIHDASKKAGVFCKECCYSFNGVLDDGCDNEDCPEKVFEKAFKEIYEEEQN